MNDSTAKNRRNLQSYGSLLEESGGPFLLGEAITYADICIMPVIVRTRSCHSDLWGSNTKVIGMVKTNSIFWAIYEKTYCEGSLLITSFHLRNG
ncbi:MAG: hypothetical protein CM15mP111_1060 [Hyphomicrobiales bacterium]|nr:MAG: hypothetical protein CM15mP111_1060 [Hyphomicrobiales bacterium]